MPRARYGVSERDVTMCVTESGRQDGHAWASWPSTTARCLSEFGISSGSKDMRPARESTKVASFSRLSRSSSRVERWQRRPCRTLSSFLLPFPAASLFRSVCCGCLQNNFVSECRCSRRSKGKQSVEGSSSSFNGKTTRRFGLLVASTVAFIGASQL